MGLGTKGTYTDGITYAFPPARGNYHRQSNIGTDWNEVRMGILGTVVPTTGSGADVAETVVVASYLDWLAFGLMNTRSDSSVIPGVAGANFLGVTSTLTNGKAVSITSNASSQGNITSNDYYKWTSALNGTSVLASTGSNDEINVAAYSTTAYAYLWALRFVVSNKGLSSQTVTVSNYMQPSGAGFSFAAQSDVIDTLTTQLQNVTYEAAAALTWNSGGAALALPDCFFIRLPFYNNVVRINGMEVLLIS